MVETESDFIIAYVTNFGLKKTELSVFLVHLTNHYSPKLTWNDSRKGRKVEKHLGETQIFDYLFTGLHTTSAVCNGKVFVKLISIKSVEI